MPDQYAGEVPALFVVLKPNAVIDLISLKNYLNENLHEAPAQPKAIKVIDALPVTAVGKVFKPTLRNLAIEEKVRLEVMAICGASATANVEISRDKRGNVVVDVYVTDAEPGLITKLEIALRPLPQSYTLRSSRSMTLESK